MYTYIHIILYIHIYCYCSCSFLLPIPHSAKLDHRAASPNEWRLDRRLRPRAQLNKSKAGRQLAIRCGENLRSNGYSMGSKKLFYKDPPLVV